MALHVSMASQMHIVSVCIYTCVYIHVLCMYNCLQQICRIKTELNIFSEKITPGEDGLLLRNSETVLTAQSCMRGHSSMETNNRPSAQDNMTT